ncbi:MAG: 16S rRNA (guanine(527)-N(7))-methyltransferase RsmG [Proteobacteria bacterium]|nr:16S rRNA (guanine(527)-N(7))-methyltransferase RsmG [Pseudomonadota bacterium]
MNIQEKFERYKGLLREWNARMNLVAPSTCADIQTRHIDDSAQLAEYIPNGTHVVDLGAGAGFPAVVLGILGFDVIAIESIAKKCAFLNAVKSELALPNLTVINDRVENYIARKTKDAYELARREHSERTSHTNGERSEQTRKTNGEIFTARAFAPLVKIFDLTYGAGLPYLLLKGENVMAEIAEAAKKYKFDTQLIPSKTGPGFIVSINRVKKP